LFSLDGYRVVNKNAKYNKCDGIIVYIREDLSFTNLDCTICEANAINILVNTRQDNYINFVAIYRSGHRVETR
jgi:hypothetical protein